MGRVLFAVLLLVGSVAIPACGDPNSDIVQDPPTDLTATYQNHPQPEDEPVRTVDVCLDGEQLEIFETELADYLDQGAYVGLCAIDLAFTTDLGIRGVDDTTDFSFDDSTHVLQRNVVSLLDQVAHISGYDQSAPCNLSHRGTRGLGVAGDEVDEIDAEEYLELELVSMHAVWTIEVRSLFTNEQDPGVEQGDVFFFLDGELVAQQHLEGVDPLGTSDGTVRYDYRSHPIYADAIVFAVDPHANYSQMSEFAVSRIAAQPMPAR